MTQRIICHTSRSAAAPPVAGRTVIHTSPRGCLSAPLLLLDITLLSGARRLPPSRDGGGKTSVPHRVRSAHRGPLVSVARSVGFSGFISGRVAKVRRSFVRGGPASSSSRGAGVGAGRRAYGPAVKAGPLPCAGRVAAPAPRRARRLDSVEADSATHAIDNARRQRTSGVRYVDRRAIRLAISVDPCQVSDVACGPHGDGGVMQRLPGEVGTRRCSGHSRLPSTSCCTAAPEISPAGLPCCPSPTASRHPRAYGVHRVRGRQVAV